MEDTHTKIKKTFLEIFQNLPDSSFDFAKDRSEYENWDSLAHMQLISQIESDFGINFEMDEIVSINTAEDLVAAVTKKHNAKS